VSKCEGGRGERERECLIEKEREKCLNNIEESESIRQRVKAREKE
jgi:hypothetical protein